MKVTANLSSGRERGVVFLALLVLLVLGLVIAGFLYVMKAQNKKSMSTTAAEVVEAGGAAISRNAQNVQRKNDAFVLLSATAEYANTNNGQLPLELKGDMLQGMGYYSSALIARGQQDSVKTNQLRLVTGARCLDGGGTADGSSRQYAAQYGLENSDGSFTPACVDG